MKENVRNRWKFQGRWGGRRSGCSEWAFWIFSSSAYHFEMCVFCFRVTANGQVRREEPIVEPGLHEGGLPGALNNTFRIDIEPFWRRTGFRGRWDWGWRRWSKSGRGVGSVKKFSYRRCVGFVVITVVQEVRIGWRNNVIISNGSKRECGGI